MTTRRARCSCGQLQIACEGEPARVSICSCKECQRRTGVVWTAQAFFPQAQTRVTGEPKIYERLSDAGRWIKFRFCPECGSTLFWEAEFRPGWWGVAVGNFDAPDSLRPTIAVWCEEKVDWAPLPEGIPTALKAG